MSEFEEGRNPRETALQRSRSITQFASLVDVPLNIVLTQAEEVGESLGFRPLSQSLEVLPVEAPSALLPVAAGQEVFQKRIDLIIGQLVWLLGIAHNSPVPVARHPIKCCAP